MDPVSLSASAVAFADAAAKLAYGCFQLYQFWESVRDAPAEVNVIKNDLLIFTKILEEIGDDKDLSPAVRSALAACQTKLDGLLLIVQQLDTSYTAATSGHRRLWTALRMTTKKKEFRSFQDGIQSLKSTLMLGLAYQSFQRPSLRFTDVDVQRVHVTALGSHTTDGPSGQIKTPILAKVDQSEVKPESPAVNTATHESVFPTKVVSRRSGCARDIIASSPRVQTFLQQSLHLAVDNLFKSGTIEQLMGDAVKQATSFDCTCRGSYGKDGPKIHNVDDLRDKGSGNRGSTSSANRSPPLLKRARVCHQTSLMGVFFGSIWIRTSTLKVEDEATESSGRAEVITSFIFYPSAWLLRFGFRFGTEANLQLSPGKGWKFHVSPIRAVPENSLIFDLCRRGDTSAVKLLLSRGDASVTDTSPKGWTPLHFAASSGHADLCAALIEAGADKTALAYQGPSENALSPIAVWGEMCQDTKAADKIQMMRVFYECLDLAEASGDGWFVIHTLVSSMSYEKVPMKDTAVSWFLRRAERGMLVGMGVTTLWDALQHSVRGFLFYEHEHLVLHHLLGLDSKRVEFSTTTQIAGLSNLIAIAACARMLLPMVIEAAGRIGVNGFDSTDRYMEANKRQFVRAIPKLYVTWCKVLPRAFETMESLIEAELEKFLDSLTLDRDTISLCIELTALEPQRCEGGHEYRCSACGMSYSSIGAGLVQPRKISFEECRSRKHTSHCRCAEYLQALGIFPKIESTPDGREWEEAEVELYSSTVDPLDRLCHAFDECRAQASSEDYFHSAILTLYRAQGRRWLGEYEPADQLCGVCLLKSEQYLGLDGSAKTPRRCTPVPEGFVASSNHAAAATF